MEMTLALIGIFGFDIPDKMNWVKLPFFEELWMFAATIAGVAVLMMAMEIVIAVLRARRKSSFVGEILLAVFAALFAVWTMWSSGFIAEKFSIDTKIADMAEYALFAVAVVIFLGYIVYYFFDEWVALCNALIIITAVFAVAAFVLDTLKIITLANTVFFLLLLVGAIMVALFVVAFIRLIITGETKYVIYLVSTILLAAAIAFNAFNRETKFVEDIIFDDRLIVDGYLLLMMIFGFATLGKYIPDEETAPAQNPEEEPDEEPIGQIFTRNITGADLVDPIVVEQIEEFDQNAETCEDDNEWVEEIAGEAVENDIPSIPAQALADEVTMPATEEITAGEEAAPVAEADIPAEEEALVAEADIPAEEAAPVAEADTPAEDATPVEEAAAPAETTAPAEEPQVPQRKEPSYSPHFTDFLTNVRNRLYFMSQIEELKACPDYEHNLAIAVFDVDHLAQTNVTKGYEAGDQFLRLTATAVEKSFGDMGDVARIDGDEFAIIIRDPKPGQISQRMLILLEALRKFNDKTGESLKVSFGYAVYNGKEDLKVEALLQVAEKRMLEKKKA